MGKRIGKRCIGAALLLGFGLCTSILKAGDGNTSTKPKGGDEAVLFDTPPAVETASLYTQTLQEAPANVTVITRQQIRNYGLRTLAETLSTVRSFFTSHDGDLYFAGVRGFALPGDYNTRFLVMINGHYMTDNVYGAMYMFGQDFGLDMDLVDRIEIVRGPSSSLYGSNGMFATVNIFTRAPSDSPRATVSTEIGSFGERKTLVSAAMYLGGGANLLLSASGFHTRGRTLELEGLGRTDRVGAEQGYHTFAQLTWRHWSFTANVQNRKAIVPTGWYGADFGNPGTSSRDSHDYVDAAYVKPIGTDSEVQWRIGVDRYYYYGRYDYTENGEVWDNRDWAEGRWMWSRFAYSKGVAGKGKLTLGGEAKVDLRAIQATEFVQPYYVPNRAVSQRDRSYGMFVQQSWNFGKNWTVYAGARFDDGRRQRPFVSPRLAAVWQASPSTSYKFMYGRAFRNPSFFEQSWEPNPGLHAENMHTIEVTREQRLGRSVRLTTSAFRYRIGGLIEGVPFGNNSLQYQNVSTGESTGFEMEASGEPWDRFEVAAGSGFSRTRFVNPDRMVPNSPAAILQARAAVPLVKRRLLLAVATRYLSSRLSPRGPAVQGGALVDFTASTNRLWRNYDLQFGVRNLADRRYADPLSTEHLTETLPRAGRSVFVKLTWRYGD